MDSKIKGKSDGERVFSFGLLLFYSFALLLFCSCYSASGRQTGLRLYGSSMV